jgi:hypothetical protein
MVSLVEGDDAGWGTGTSRTIDVGHEGLERCWWVEFDEPQFDDEGEGPMAGGEFSERLIERLPRHRRYDASDANLLPWPIAIPGHGGTLSTRWMATYRASLVAADLEAFRSRLALEDPQIEVDVIPQDCNLTLTFTWSTEYGADELSRSVCVLLLSFEILGTPLKLMGRDVREWPFVR